MNRFTRIKEILIGLFTIMISILMLAVPDLGYVLATLILGSVLLLDGLRQFIYFLSMGIHMVGGKVILYRAFITMDIGLFTISLHETGQNYVMFYFTLYYAFAGIVSSFRAIETRKQEAGSWKMLFGRGIYDVTVAGICLLNMNSEGVMLDVLCLSMMISAISRIANALRKSAIVYIP